MLKETRESVQRQLKLYGDQETKTDELEIMRLKAEIRFLTFMQMVKRVHKSDVQIMKTLGLTGKRLKSLEGFIQQSTQFYENAINDDTIFAKIEALVGTKENLQAGFDLVAECISLNKEQEDLKGKAQKATEKRNKNVKELHNYVANFTIACRSTFKEEPQILEQLKIKAYSKNYKKKIKKTTDPTDPTTPTDPTDPTDPTEPTTPTDPGDPTDPPAPVYPPLLPPEKPRNENDL